MQAEAKELFARGPLPLAEAIRQANAPGGVKYRQAKPDSESLLLRCPPLHEYSGGHG
jgi:hypothetical protein